QSNGRIEIDNVDQREGNVDDYYDIQETNHANGDTIRSTIW
ncbi:18131_t:CDS:2, partial [Funneliformis geosporum]